jgi:hypothetical protein
VVGYYNIRFGPLFAGFAVKTLPPEAGIAELRELTSIQQVQRRKTALILWPAPNWSIIGAAKTTQRKKQYPLIMT